MAIWVLCVGDSVKFGREFKNKCRCGNAWHLLAPTCVAREASSAKVANRWHWRPRFTKMQKHSTILDIVVYKARFLEVFEWNIIKNEH